MLSAIAPFGLDDLIRNLVRELPPPFVVPAFVTVLTIYLYVASRLINAVLSRLDYSVATALRRLRLHPPTLQIFLGNVLERLPGWIVLLGVVCITVSVPYAFAVNAPGRTAPTGLLLQLITYWTQFIGWLWS